MVQGEQVQADEVGGRGLGTCDLDDRWGDRLRAGWQQTGVIGGLASPQCHV